MSEALRHQRDVHAGGQHQARRAVSKIVQPDRTQPGGDGELAEPLRDHVERKRVPVLPSEHQAVVDVGAAPLGALGVLGETMGEQYANGAGVEIHPPRLSGGGFGRPETVAAVHQGAGRTLLLVPGLHLHVLLADDEAGALDVDGIPPQPSGFTATEAGRGDQLEQGPERIRQGVVEELAQLLRLPGADLRARHSGEGRVRGGVERHGLGAQGVVERGAQRGVDSANSGRTEAGLPRRPQHRGHVRRAQIAETKGAEVGEDPVAAVLAV